MNSSYSNHCFDVNVLIFLINSFCIAYMENCYFLEIRINITFTVVEGAPVKKKSSDYQEAWQFCWDSIHFKRI